MATWINLLNLIGFLDPEERDSREFAFSQLFNPICNAACSTSRNCYGPFGASSILPHHSLVPLIDHLSYRVSRTKPPFADRMALLLDHLVLECLYHGLRSFPLLFIRITTAPRSIA